MKTQFSEIAAPPRPSWQTYHEVTRTARYGFLMALPLLLAYEGMILLVNRGALMQVRVGAEVWMKQLLALLGGTGWAALGVAVLVVGAAVLFFERRKHIPVRPRYFAWMVAESAVYAVVLALLVSSAVGLLFAFSLHGPAPLLLAAPQAADLGFWTRLTLSIGAGIYEELLFRVLLVGGLYAVLRQVARRERAYVAAAIIGALLFSAVHYIGALGDVFTLPSFTFRFLFGLALNAVFLVRGFGIAVWTHALYDVFLILGFGS